jgi:hypothetical protein
MNSPDVRSASKADNQQIISVGPLCATRRHSRLQQKLRLIGPHPHLVVGSTNHLTSDCSNRSLLSPSAVSRLPLQRQ